MVQIETIHQWNPFKNDSYHVMIDNSLLQLERHTGRALRDFGAARRKGVKVSVDNGDVFGELFFMPEITQPCTVLREFVRKAVSWSKDIARAIVACRCETPVEIYKIKSRASLQFFV